MWIPDVGRFWAVEMVSARAKAAVHLSCPGRGRSVAGKVESSQGSESEQDEKPVEACVEKWHDVTCLM